MPPVMAAPIVTVATAVMSARLRNGTAGKVSGGVYAG